MYDRIKLLCKKHGISVNKLEQELGIARGSLCKMNTNKPSLDRAKKIADYFGVTVDYLMNGNDISQTSEPTLTQKDRQDIAKHVDSILSQLDSGEALMFDGEPMNEETKALLRASLENSVKMAKITAKKKFTPKKYR